MANFTRLTETRTSAPSLSSLSRIVPQAASANWVCGSPMRRGAHEHVGHRGEPQPELVRPHGGGRGPVREQIALRLLDAVFHIAPRAVDLFVEMAAVTSPGFREVTMK